MMIYVLGAIIVCVLLFAKMALVIIPQSETKIVERLGRYYATLQPGINIIIPFVDRPKTIVTLSRGRYVYSNVIDLREQVYDFDKQNVITKDNIQMQINALLYFQIVDPFKAVYEINNLPNAIEKLTQTTLRNIIGEMELDQTLTSRENHQHQAACRARRRHQQVGHQGQPRGAAGHHAAAERAQRHGETDAGRARQARHLLTSEGDKQAQILQSEGEKAAKINRAEAEKQQAILLAEGEAQARIRKAEAEAIAIEKITEAVGQSTNPANYLLAQNTSR
jgi:regulator of protease activity HflC (stomatin/prohibitin superfamily)